MTTHTQEGKVKGLMDWHGAWLGRKALAHDVECQANRPPFPALMTRKCIAIGGWVYEKTGSAAADRPASVDLVDGLKGEWVAGISASRAEPPNMDAGRLLLAWRPRDADGKHADKVETDASYQLPEWDYPGTALSFLRKACNALAVSLNEPGKDVYSAGQLQADQWVLPVNLLRAIQVSGAWDWMVRRGPGESIEVGPMKSEDLRNSPLAADTPQIAEALIRFELMLKDGAATERRKLHGIFNNSVYNIKRVEYVVR